MTSDTVELTLPITSTPVPTSKEWPRTSASIWPMQNIADVNTEYVDTEDESEDLESRDTEYIKVEKYRHEICERYFGKIRSYLRDKPTRFHLVNEDFAIENTILDGKLKYLKRKIIEVASQQPYWGEQIPARWIPLEQKLMRLRAAGIKVIPWSLLEDLNKAGTVQISTDELDLFLRFQHDIGTIVYFSTEVLKTKIVLDPQWMIDALKSLITAEMFVLRNTPAVSKKWFEFKENGKLFPELIDAIWTKENNPDLHDNREHILLLMEQMNIIAKPMVYGEDALEVKEQPGDVDVSRVNKTKRKAKQQTSEKLSSTKRKRKRISALKGPVAKKISNTSQSDVPDKAEITDVKGSKKKGVSCSDPELLCQVLQSTQVASSSRTTLEGNCLTVGLKFHGETPGNGNCFFEAVSSQLHRLNCAVQKSPQQLRQDVVAFMKANTILQVSEGTINLAEFIQNGDFDEYCERMARDGEWADHVVVVGMARMLQKDIMIITSAPSAGPDDVIVWVVGQTNFQGQLILLGHIWECHYQSLQPITPASPMTLVASSPMPALTSSPNPDPTSVSQSAPAFGTIPALPCCLPPPPAAIPIPGLKSCSTPATTAGSIPAPTGVTIPIQTAVPTVLSAAGTTLFLTPSSTPSTMVNPMSALTSSFTPTTTSGPIPASTSNIMAASTAVPTLVSCPTPVLTPISTPTTMDDSMSASTSGLTPVSTASPLPVPVVDDTDRFMHVACLLVNVGSKVLRRLLLHHAVNPACTLDQYLAYNRTVIGNLQKRQILNKSQMDILFPPGGSTNLADYDITLLSTLFINIVPSLSPQEETMIKTLRENRNKIFAHAKSIMVNPNDYQKYWNDIRLTLLALCKQCGDPDFENEISKEIQDVQVSAVQGTYSVDILRTQSSRIETLEKLVQALMSIHALEPKKQSDESES